MSASKSDSKTNTTTLTQDQRMAVGGNGTIVGLTGATIKGNTTLNLTDGGLVAAALDFANGIAQSAGAAVSAANAGSNQIAAQVADSQRAFVETASGQKTILWIVGGLLAFYLLFKR